MARLNELAIRAVVPLALAAMAACGGQLTPTQTGTGGNNGRGGAGGGGSQGTGGTGGACSAPSTDGSIIICASNCSSDIAVSPICVGNAWTCPAGTLDVRTCFSRCSATPPPRGCFCNPATGVVTCADGGAECADAGQSRLVCAGSCSTDVAFPAICTGGAWTCPAGTIDVTTCSGFCTLPPPPGCTCDPSNGALTCKRDGGADAAPPRG